MAQDRVAEHAPASVFPPSGVLPRLSLHPRRRVRDDGAVLSLQGLLAAGYQGAAVLLRVPLGFTMADLASIMLVGMK